MPVLADFVYPQSPEFAVTRPAVLAVALGWQPDAIALASGRYSIYREFSFGGYVLHVEFKEWVWEWGNKTFRLGEMFENYYVIPPGGGSPSSAGTVFLSWEIEQEWLSPIINITNPASAPHYYFQRFPGATRPYWSLPVDNVPPTPFWFP